MKLYTEEQLKNSMNSMITYIKVYNENVIDKIVKNHIDALTPIELPSDEEIKKESEWLDNHLERLNFQEGIRWMRDKIQGGNNEQQTK